MKTKKYFKVFKIHILEVKKYFITFTQIHIITRVYIITLQDSDSCMIFFHLIFIGLYE